MREENNYYFEEGCAQDALLSLFYMEIDRIKKRVERAEDFDRRIQEGTIIADPKEFVKLFNDITNESYRAQQLFGLLPKIMSEADEASDSKD